MFCCAETNQSIGVFNLPRKRKNPPFFTKGIADSWKKEKPDTDLSHMLLSIYAVRLGRILGNDFDKLCQDHFKIRGPDMRVLYTLRRSGPPYALRPTDLFRLTLVTSGAITKQVDRLENSNLIQRLPDPRNSGGNLVQLTKEGLELTEKVVDIQLKELPISDVLSGMSVKKLNEIIDFFEITLASLENKKSG